MQERGYSVRTLAGRLGVQPRTVQRWRDGTSRVPPMAELALQALAHPKPQRQERPVEDAEPIPEPERIPYVD